MANLVPYSKSSKNAIVRADKFFNVKSSKTNVNFSKPKESKDSSTNILLQIEKKVIKIDKLLKDSFALKKKQQKKSTIKEEQKEFEDREKELEKKKPKKEKGVNLPTPTKMGFLDWIKNFIAQTLLGFIAVRLIDFLPQLLKILPVIIKVTDFITDIGGKLLNRLVTFIDWGYKAYDSTKGFVKNIFGEGGVKQFEQLSGLLNKFLNLAIIAGLVAAGSGGLGKGTKPGARPTPGKGGRPKVTTSGGGGVGGPDIRNPLRQRPTVTTSGGGTGGFDIRNPLRQGPKITTSGGGTKGLLRTVRPFLKRIPLPVVGALIDFGLSVALGENPGRAAFRAIGAGILGAVGAAVGSIIPVAGNLIGGIAGGILGDAAGGALYDLFFNGKKPNIKQRKINKLAGGGKPTPSTGSGKSVGRTLKKKKKKARSLSFIPAKIKPGKSAGGEDKVQSVFPNPEKQWWDPFGLFSGKPQQQEEQPKKPTEKVANPQEFLLKSNDVLGRSDFFGPFFTLALKSVLGDKPNNLDYLKVGQGLNSWMQTVFKTGPLGFAGGGEVDAKQFFGGEDYTQVIAKSVEESVSKEVDTTIRNLKDELALKRPVGKEEMIQENIQKGTEGDSEFGGGFDEAGIDSGEMDLFTRMVYAEAGGEGKTGMSLVARAILNRAGLIQSGKVRAGTFNSNSGSITDVIKAPKQFSPMTDGRIKQRLTDSQINQSKDAIKLAQNPTELMKVLKSEGLDESTIKKLIAVTGFRNKSVARYDASQDVNEVNYKRHTFNTAGNTSLIVPKSVAVSTATTPGSVNLRGGDGKFIQGNSGRSGGVHFHIGTNKPGDASGSTAAGFNVIKHFLGKKSIHVGRSQENIPSNATDEQIKGYIARGQASHATRGRGRTELDLQIGGLDGRKNNVPFPLALKNMNYSATNGYGVSADIVGTNAFVGHGRYKPDGSLALQQGTSSQGPLSSGAPDFYAFHGMNKVMSKDGLLKFHKGEYISVTDADSFRLVGNILTDINNIENRSQLIAKAPSIIEKLKAISGYTDYENPNQEPQIVYIEVPVEVPVPIGSGSGGGNIFIGGGVNSTNNNMEQTLSQIG